MITDRRLSIVPEPAAEPYPDVGETWAKPYRDWFYMIHGMSRDGLVRGAPPVEKAVETYELPVGAGTASAHLADFLEAVQNEKRAARATVTGPRRRARRPHGGDGRSRTPNSVARGVPAVMSRPVSGTAVARRRLAAGLGAAALPLRLVVVTPGRRAGTYENARAVGKRCSTCHTSTHPGVANLNEVGKYYLVKRTLDGAPTPGKGGDPLPAPAASRRQRPPVRPRASRFTTAAVRSAMAPKGKAHHSRGGSTASAPWPMTKQRSRKSFATARPAARCPDLPGR